MDVCDNTIEIEKKKIALIGDKYMCRRFYLQFGSSLNIRYLFFTNLDSACFFTDSFFKEHESVKCMAIDSAVINEQGLFLVLCMQHAGRIPYDNLLFNMGFEWGTHYVDFHYVVQYYRHKYLVDLEEKDIWIFGAGNNGKYFYEAYRNTGHIQGFVSNYENEDEYMGLPVIRPEELLRKTDFYIVICSEADAVMAKQLEGIGLMGGKEYGFWEMLPKKLFIAMGICQVREVADALSQNRFFSNYYQMDIYVLNAYGPFNDADNRRIKGYGKFCDVVFYNVVGPAGLTELRDFEPMIKQYYQNANCFHIPFYYFKGQLMQATDSVNHYAMEELRPYKVGLQFWYKGDKEINYMVENDVPMEEIVEKISEEQYWPVQDIIDNFNKELKKIEIMDRFSSFPIKSFIEENYKKILIFIDSVHFSGQLSAYLADEIAKQLKIEPIGDREIVNEGEGVVTSIMPVYPCVKRALEMERGDYYQYYNFEKNRAEYLDVKEYARRYIRYVMDVREIHHKVGTLMAY